MSYWAVSWLLIKRLHARPSRHDSHFAYDTAPSDALGWTTWTRPTASDTHATPAASCCTSPRSTSSRRVAATRRAQCLLSILVAAALCHAIQSVDALIAYKSKLKFTNHLIFDQRQSDKHMKGQDELQVVSSRLGLHDGHAMASAPFLRATDKKISNLRQRK